MYNWVLKILSSTKKGMDFYFNFLWSLFSLPFYWPDCLKFSTSLVLMYFHSIFDLIPRQSPFPVIMNVIWEVISSLLDTTWHLHRFTNEPCFISDQVKLLLSVLCDHILHSAWLLNYLILSMLMQWHSQHGILYSSPHFTWGKMVLLNNTGPYSDRHQRNRRGERLYLLRIDGKNLLSHGC